MSVAPIAAGWYRVKLDLGCAWLWCEPDHPRQGWISAWRSRQAVAEGDIVAAILMREDEFQRCVVERISASPRCDQEHQPCGDAGDGRRHQRAADDEVPADRHHEPDQRDQRLHRLSPGDVHPSPAGASSAPTVYGEERG